jgi:hypothetical protein
MVKLFKARKVFEKRKKWYFGGPDCNECLIQQFIKREGITILLYDFSCINESKRMKCISRTLFQSPFFWRFKWFSYFSPICFQRLCFDVQCKEIWLFQLERCWCARTTKLTSYRLMRFRNTSPSAKRWVISSIFLLLNTFFLVVKAKLTQTCRLLFFDNFVSLFKQELEYLVSWKFRLSNRNIAFLMLHDCSEKQWCYTC